MALKRLALVACVVAVVLVPATAASAGRHPAKLNLSLVPLQKAQLGPDGASLELNHDGSGPVPNAGATQTVFGTFPTQLNFPWQVIGRVAGYGLDYGDPLSGSTGVTEIRTGVEKYKSAAYARSGLNFWRAWDELFTGYTSSTLPVTVTWLKRPAVGKHGFASLATFAAPSLNPIVRLDEQVADGPYVLSVTVTAGSEAAAKQATPGLLKTLDTRLHRVVAGHSVGTPAKLPHEPVPGQAPGGPDLSAAALQLSDVGQSHWVSLSQRYVSDPFALSSYRLTASPAGQYDGLGQDITWWPTATEATYAEAYQGHLLDGLYALGAGASITSVDLSSLSDPANGVLMAGSSRSYVVITLTRGQAGEHVFATSDTTLTAADVQNLAQAAAARLDAAIP